MRLQLAIVLLLLVPLAPASAPDAAPRLGDGAEYLLSHEGSVQRVFLEWRAEPTWLPTGEERTLATLRAIHTADEPRPQALQVNPWNEAGMVPRDAHVVDLHWTDFGGESVAWSVSWMDAGERHRHWATRTTLGSCPHQAWFISWIDPSCASNATIAPGSGTSFPQAVQGPDWTLELVAQRAGDTPLPSSPALPSPPTVRLVEWSAHGPASGDLASYPFSASRSALLEQDPDAAAWTAQHPDARVMQARHTWSTTLSGSWGDRMKGVPCTVTPAAHTPGAEWASSWIDDGGSLFTIVQRVGAPLAVDRLLYSHLDNFNTHDAGGTPTTLAPAPQDLMEHLDLVPPSRGEIATLEFDFLPDGAIASVARGSCTRDPTTGMQSFQGRSIGFRHGIATSTLTLTAESDRPMLPVGPAKASGSGPDQGAATPSFPTGLTPTTAAAVAAGVAALVGAAFFYSRIDRNDALANAKRARIYAFIRTHPGESLQDIGRALGIPRNTVEHHVRTLERTGHVTVHDAPHGKAIRASEQPPSPHDALLARQHVKELIELIHARPGRAQGELAEELGMRKSHFSRLVRELEAAGLIVRRRAGRRQEVHPADDADAR